MITSAFTSTVLITVAPRPITQNTWITLPATGGLHIPPSSTYVELSFAVNLALADKLSGADFTGTISGALLTVTTVSIGTIAVNQIVKLQSNWRVTFGIITSFGTGSGGTGTYNLNTSGSLAIPTLLNSRASIQTNVNYSLTGSPPWVFVAGLQPWYSYGPNGISGTIPFDGTYTNPDPTINFPLAPFLGNFAQLTYLVNGITTAGETINGLS